MPTDDGALDVPVSAYAPSVASLAYVRPAFESTGASDRAGQVQRLVLELRNPLPAPVSLGATSLSATRADGFAVQSDRCQWARLGPGGSCRVSVLYRPSGPRAARATLIVRGGGDRLRIGLRAGPLAPPAIKRLAAPACLARTARVAVHTDQPALVRWHALRSTPLAASACGRHGARDADTQPGRSSAAGRTRTTAADHGAAGGFTLPRGLRPGTYVLSVSASNPHGTGESETISLTVLP